MLADKYSPDAVRYYLTSDITTGQDADFSEERLIERYNTDLGNTLGNLVNRTINMIRRYRAGILTKFERVEFPPESSFGELVASTVEQYLQELEHCSVDDAIERAVNLAQLCNLQIEVSAPWKLAKEQTKETLDQLLFGISECLRVIAILISPVLPQAAHRIFDQLNWKTELSGKEGRFSLTDAEWGRLPDGHVVGKPVPLFPRIES